MVKRRLALFLFAATACSYPLLLFFQSCGNNDSANSEPSVNFSENDFIGPDGCKSCHAKEYNDWLLSDHFKAMMVANDSTVLGDFNEKELQADGVTTRFFKRNGKFFINTEGGDGKNHDYEVKYTFGYYPLQQYLVEFPGEKMQVPRVSYDVVKRQWFHQYSGQKIEHHDWLHWTKQSQNWNSMCATCHSTNLQRNYDETTGSYHTTYSHITVSCESCHGMGKNHAEYINSAAYQSGGKVEGSYLLLHKGQRNEEQLSGCVQCHARRMEISQRFIASTEALDNFIPNLPTTEHYHPDGQIREEAYEYGSFTQSKMYHRGVKCSDCHNPHTGRISLAGNKLCLQCHKADYDSPQHHFHAANTDGAQCVNCHMPAHVYMGNDSRLDHSFRVPRPDQSAQYDTPNACNQCHADRSAKWAADAVVKWYGAERKHHYSDDLIPGSMLHENSFSHLQKLLGDTSATEMVRATAINYLGEILTDESIHAIKTCLHDTIAMVRYEAVTALSNFPHERWVSDITPLLNDPVRAVRISAANALSVAPQSAFDKNSSPSFASTHNELMDFLHHQSDFATGNIMLGDYYFKTGDNQNAEKYYLRTLKIDSLANYARLNLSSAYNAEGKNAEALAILREAFAVDPQNPRISYNLALLHAELGEKSEALKYFELTRKLNYAYDRFYYNYALYQQQLDDKQKAELLFNEGLKLFPDSEPLNYGAAYFFLQTKRKEKALVSILKLKELNPGNQSYGELFRLLK